MRKLFGRSKCQHGRALERVKERDVILQASEGVVAGCSQPLAKEEGQTLYRETADSSLALSSAQLSSRGLAGP